MSVKLGIISLGCDKNRVDTENLLAYAGDAGIEFTADENEADVILSIPARLSKKASRKPSTPFWNLSKRKRNAISKSSLRAVCPKGTSRKSSTQSRK